MRISERYLTDPLRPQPGGKVKTELCGRIFVEMANYRERDSATSQACLAI